MEDSKPFSVRHVGQSLSHVPYVIERTSQPRRIVSTAGPSGQQVVRTVVSAPNAQYLHFDRYPGYDGLNAKKGEDKSKGLRHFSTKVCEKVKQKGRTNYNEVADELVQEYFESQASYLPFNDEKHQYDMKNIRRRVYDALNVLLAMNIIQKNKKDITWVGLPTTTAQEFKRLEEDKVKRAERICQKMENLQEMIIQLVAYKSLVESNRERERREGRPADNAVLYLPYVIINTEKRAVVDCSVANDKSEFLFNFDQPFEIHDDVEVLKRLGHAHGMESGHIRPEAADKIKQCLPPALRVYVDDIMNGRIKIPQRETVVQKPTKYTVPLVRDREPKPTTMTLSSHSHHIPTSQHTIVRAPVMARTVPGSRYVVKQQQLQQRAVQSQPPRRYQQVVVRQQAGGQRVVLQRPVAQARPQTVTVQRYVQHPVEQYYDPGDVYEEVYEEVEGEEAEYM